MKLTIGIDVSKAELVVYAFENYYTIANESGAIKAFLSAHAEPLKAMALIVFEATGGYERTLRDCLIQAQLPYHLAHPNKIRAFAKAEGYLAKTDRLDAKVIALWCFI